MKRISKINLLIVLAVIVTGMLLYVMITDDEPTDRSTTQTETIQEQLPEPEIIAEPDKQVTFLSSGELDCSENCWLAPVDKDHSLPATYAPDTEPTGLSGGRELVSEAAGALRDLFAAAADDGISLGVISAYRSYDYQTTLFNTYVAAEKAKGFSQTEAEEQANTYSARPGTSEHQLGTTADIGCAGCAFEESQANLDAWAWLTSNAHKFGFVLSYPEGKTGDTGYIYEPWHYRYIGRQNAAKYVGQTELTLNRWLAQVPSPAS